MAQRRHWVSVQAAPASRVGGLASTSLLSPLWSTCPQRTYLGRISWGAKCCTANWARQPKSRCGTELQRRCSFIKADRTNHKLRVFLFFFFPPTQRTTSVPIKGWSDCAFYDETWLPLSYPFPALFCVFCVPPSSQQVLPISPLRSNGREAAICWQATRADKQRPTTSW